MIDQEGKILYIGKARHLKKRVASYFQKKLMQPRLVSLVKQIHRINVIVTRNENEALLLENQLIKQHRPRYNILLRDDKSYPYIVLSRHTYPRLTMKRGNIRKGEDEMFGPYPSSIAVRETLKLMQKIFKLRTCQDSFFKNRSRPCLLYQLKKCTAPCVKAISQENYREEVKNARLFLKGRNEEMISHLITRMENASQAQHYELAAHLRDQIGHLRHIQTTQRVTDIKRNRDVWVVVTQQAITAVELLSIREGYLAGNQLFYPEMPFEASSVEILSAFIPQYYSERNVISAQDKRQQKGILQVIVKEKLPDQQWLEKALGVNIIQAKRGEKLQWIKMAEKTGEETLKAKLAVNQQYIKRWEALRQLLQLEVLPQRIVCFDISHSSGEAATASCVVFDHTGAVKKAYRHYYIHLTQKGDDYAAMYQALDRYFHKQEILPDILLIDGGKGQMKQAERICEKRNIHTMQILAIAKGITRKPGLERIFVSGQKVCLDIAADSEALHLLQYIRDEAHRFAIQTHRKKRTKNRMTSVLESIPGIGTKRRTALLRQLGGLAEIKRASIEQLQKVEGIHLSLAEKIYQVLHH